MKLQFWGVRGSLPTPGPNTVKYGGNTPCFEVAGEQGECLILDAGTGIRLLGLDLMKRHNPLPPIHLFISHTHWDHIHGFPFFAPCYVPGTIMEVKGPVQLEENKTLQSVFDLQMKYEYFPISNKQLAAQIHYESLGETKLQVGNIQIQTQFVNHPILSLGFRLTEKNRSLVYTGDHEPYHNLFAPKQTVQPGNEDDTLFGTVDLTVNDANQRFIHFIRKANVLLIDCSYTPEEYRASKRNWGHSSWDYCLKWMQEGEVERMILTHHDTLRTDNALDEMLAAVRKAAKEQGIEPERITMATEGVSMEI